MFIKALFVIARKMNMVYTYSSVDASYKAKENDPIVHDPREAK